MLIEKESLRIFLSPAYADLSSDTVLEKFWNMKGSIFEIIPKTCFKKCYWSNLPRTKYAVFSYQWKSKLGHIAKFVFGEDNSPNPIQSDWIWLDLTCLNQLDDNRMTTIQRSDEIYYYATEYHLMEVGSLSRGWVLFELSSVPKDKLPTTHFTTSDADMLDMAKETFKTEGFEGSEFTKESDRILVRCKIIQKYGDISSFNNKIAEIVDKL